LQESRISPIVQLSKHYYRRSKHEACQSMFAAVNVFFHSRQLINFTISLSETCLQSVRIGLLTGRYTHDWTVNLLVHGTCLD